MGDYLDQAGLWACLRGLSCLLIDVEKPSPLWAAPFHRVGPGLCESRKNPIKKQVRVCSLSALDGRFGRTSYLSSYLGILSHNDGLTMTWNCQLEQGEMGVWCGGGWWRW